MSTVEKSYYTCSDPIINYCTNTTVKLHPLQDELQHLTLTKCPGAKMLGAPEVLTFGQHFIKLIKAKRAIDVGTFTGASSLAWALALPADGEVHTLDVDLAKWRTFGVPVVSKSEETLKKVLAVQGPALEYLDKLIADGQQGTFDFAFIDADKENYSNYYDRLVTLLRSGGVILVDNTLWHGRVAEIEKYPDDDQGIAIDELNKRIFNDPRTNSILLNLGDGTHVAFKI